MSIQKLKVAFNWIMCIIYFIGACMIIIPTATLLALFSNGFINLILEKARLLIKYVPPIIIPKRNK